MVIFNTPHPKGIQRLYKKNIHNKLKKKYFILLIITNDFIK